MASRAQVTNMSMLCSWDFNVYHLHLPFYATSCISYLKGKILIVDYEGGGSKGCKYQQGS
jgi:hypothetical protein